jgi:hypothetical protein
MGGRVLGADLEACIRSLLYTSNMIINDYPKSGIVFSIALKKESRNTQSPYRRPSFCIRR